MSAKLCFPGQLCEFCQRESAGTPALEPFTPPAPRPTPPVERYVRASVDIPGGSIELGYQYDLDANGRTDTRGTAACRAALRGFADRAARHTLQGRDLTEVLADELTDALSDSIAAVTAPGIGWFVEVWNEREALTRVYAPCGMPKETT